MKPSSLAGFHIVIFLTTQKIKIMRNMTNKNFYLYETESLNKYAIKPSYIQVKANNV